MVAKVFEPAIGPPCPICDKERVYKTPTGLRIALRDNKPCRSCSNSIKGGGQGDIKKRGCFVCGEQEIHYSSLCRDCHNNRSKKYHKEVYRWSKYGLDGPVEMVACEICASPDDLVIDHCHTTNKFRGILCRTCNVGIGLLKDDLTTITKAYEYAKRTFNES